tara:strand:+ start:95 stop:271 length:177 start_codon:yes stop_codon:yes gene_type:complete
MSDRVKDLRSVARTLDIAEEYQLQPEVMFSAILIAMEAKENDMSMEDVLSAALQEWDI